MVIHRYLFFQYFKSALSILFFVLGIFYLVTYIEDNQFYFPGYNPDAKTIFLYYFWQLPSTIVTFAPFCVLISGIVTNWTLARHGEISALRAAGASILKISTPLLMVGILFTAFQFYLDELVIPEATIQFLKVKKVDLEKRDRDNIFIQSKWIRTTNSVLHFNQYDETKQVLQKPELFLFNTSGMAQKIVQAKWAQFDTQLGFWVFHDSLITTFDNSSQVSNIEQLSNFVTSIDFAPPKVLTENSNSSQLSYWQLKKIIDEATSAGNNVSDRIIDLQMKLSQPFANLLFAFLSIPFAIRRERQDESYMRIILYIVVSLVFWFGNISLRNFAAKGVLNPYIAAWIMNILLLTLSIIFIRKIDKGLDS